MNSFPITRQANAKINLYLHVTRKREDGYHDLDSLIAFTNFGDQICVQESSNLSLSIDGPFSNALSPNEQTLDRSSHNILAKTLWSIADHANKTPSFHITLTKNTPLGSGLGGGSADAAALAQILCEAWDIDHKQQKFKDILFALGADVPLCFHGKTCRIKDAGEEVIPAPAIPTLYSILVYPNQHCSTVDIFKANKTYSSSEVSIPETLSTVNNVINLLSHTKNDLTKTAQECIPEIKKILHAINDQEDVLAVRMSGSGSTCFGIFKNKEASMNAAMAIKNLHPNWWVQAIETL